MASAAAARQRLRDLLAPVVAAHDAELEDVAVSRAGSRSIVRVVVDREGGLDLDAVATVSRAVDTALDADEDVVPGAYVLEVSTPGVDRPLTEPRHWRRAVGRLVDVRRHDGSRLRGRVLEAGEASAVVREEATFERGRRRRAGGDTTVGYAEVARAGVEVEFAANGAADTEADTEADAEADADAETNADPDGPDAADAAEVPA